MKDFPGFGDWWHSFECRCGCLWDIRTTKQLPSWCVCCPLCGCDIEVKAIWEGTPDGYKSEKP